MTEDKKGVSVGLGEGYVELTYEEARDLAHLRTTPGWQVLRTILKSLMDGTTIALRDRTKTLEDLRFCQGQAEASGRIADIVEDELPQWYAGETAEGSGEGHE